MLKLRFWRLLYCAWVMRRRPVAESATAPVARLYFVNASQVVINIRRLGAAVIDIPVAIRTRVVPVSTIPAVEERIEVLEP